MMVRDVLTGVAMVSTLGASAFGQATFVSIEQRVAVQASCGSTSNADRTSSVVGVFSDSVQTTNQYGLFRAAVDTNLRANLLSGSYNVNSTFCGSSTVSVIVRFTLPERQKWRIRWNAGVFGQSIVLYDPNGGFSIQANSTDSVEVLEPGTYELRVVQGGNEQVSNGGTFALTRMPPETSQLVTYQGALLEGGVPYAGTADVQFTLFDAASGGAQVGDPMVVTGVAVNEGKFAAAFAPDVLNFNAASLFVEVAVRTAPGAFVPLAGRQPLNATPFAFQTNAASTADVATVAAHAASADSATSAASATSAISVVHAAQANHADSAGNALLADTVSFSAITSNPWARTGSLLSTMQWVGLSKIPVDVLDVQGVMRINDQNLYLRGSGDNNHGLGWFGTGKQFAGASFDGPVLFGYSGGLLGTRQGGERVALSWNASGQVGIGTTNTSGFALAVNGTAAKTGGGSWSVLSDPRTKTDIVPLSGALDRLMRLHGYEYTYKPEFVESGLVLPGRQIGLMASEVAEVFPDWVVRGSDGYQRVVERSTTALMVEAIREVRARKDAGVNELRERLRKIDESVGAASAGH